MYLGSKSRGTLGWVRGQVRYHNVGVPLGFQGFGSPNTSLIKNKNDVCTLCYKLPIYVICRYIPLSSVTIVSNSVVDDITLFSSAALTTSFWFLDGLNEDVGGGEGGDIGVGDGVGGGGLVELLPLWFVVLASSGCNFLEEFSKKSFLLLGLFHMEDWSLYRQPWIVM